MFSSRNGFFISALGKIVAESGGSHILDECKVLVKGSINSFLKGRSYKQGTRMHELLALDFEILHFGNYSTVKDSIWIVPNTSGSIPAPKNLMILPKTTFCISLQQ